MKNVFLFILIALSFHAYADDAGEERKSNYKINVRYKAGPFLVYDCEGQYYACVDQDGHTSCSEKRAKSIEKKEKTYPCAPLKKFESKEKCLEKNYEVLESVAVKRFCFPRN